MEQGIGRIKTDEIRGNRIGVMSFLASCEASSLKARSCLIAPDSRGPFYCSSVVVSRFTLHALTRKTAVGGARDWLSNSQEWEPMKRMSGSPAQKGRCVNPRRRCGAPELPGSINNGMESWPRSSILRSPIMVRSATRYRSLIDSGHYYPPLN